MRRPEAPQQWRRSCLCRLRAAQCPRRRLPASVHAVADKTRSVARAPSATGIIEAWLKTAGTAVLARLGPADFLRQNGLTLKEGASIVVKGYRAASSDDDLLIATEVEIGGKTLLLRSGRGRPLW